MCNPVGKAPVENDGDGDDDEDNHDHGDDYYYDDDGNTFRCAILWAKSWLRSLILVASSIRARRWLKMIL